MKISRSALRGFIIETILEKSISADPKVDYIEFSPGEVQMPVDDMFTWTRAPTGSDVLMLDYNQAMQLRELPALGKPPQEFKREFWTMNPRFKFGVSSESVYSPKWSIKAIHEYIFGTIGTHRYVSERPGFEVHPSLDKLMLPPAWTIGAVEGAKRAKVTKSKLDKATTEDEKSEIAQHQGFFGRGSILELERALSALTGTGLLKV